MKSLIYISHETTKLSLADLHDLLYASREKNLAYKITGILFYIEGVFIQYIEGADENIDALYSSLLRDNRHRDLKKISEEKIMSKRCDTWEMVFKNLSLKEMREITGVKLIEETDFFNLVSNNNKHIYTLLDYFH